MSIPYLTNNPLQDLTPEFVENKLLESVGNVKLDSIRQSTFRSLLSSDATEIYLGVRRAIQILCSTGNGFFLKHAFSFNPKWLSSVSPSEIEGLSISEVCTTNSLAYERLYREYLREYQRTSDYSKNKELVKLSNIDRTYPTVALPLVRLLMLIVVTSKLGA